MSKAIRRQILLNEGLLEAIDDFRRTQPDVPNRSEAIRRLLEVGLHYANIAAEQERKETAR